MAPSFPIEVTAYLFDPRRFEQPVDPKKFLSIHKKAYKIGVRPGQSWTCPGLSSEPIAILGCTSSGFVVAKQRRYEISQPVNPPLVTFIDGKKALENIIENPAGLASVVSPHLLSPDGMPLPNHAIDVMLSSLNLYPLSWHLPSKHRNHYLTCCEAGHYVFSEDHQEIGTFCSDRCITSKNDPEVIEFLSSIILPQELSKILPRNHKISGLIPDEDWRACTAFLPSVNVASLSHEKKRLLDAYTSGQEPVSIEAKVNSTGGELSKSAWWLSKMGVKSGNIFPIITKSQNPSGSKRHIRLHLRSCGYFHIEATDQYIFQERPSASLMKEMCHQDGFQLYLSSSTHLPSTISGRCPACKAADPVLVLKDFSSLPKTCTPSPVAAASLLPTIKTRKAEVSPGMLVIFEGKTHYVCKPSTTPTGLSRLILMKPNGKLTSARPESVKIIPAVTQDQLRAFIGEDSLLLRPFMVDRWHENITVGSKLKIVLTSNSDPRKIPLDGAIVTSSGPVFAMGSMQTVEVLESDLVFLAEELSPVKTVPLCKGMKIQRGEEISIIDRFSPTTISLLPANEAATSGSLTGEVPTAGIQLMLTRRMAITLPSETVADLLKATL